jgi:hypothetical protein
MVRASMLVALLVVFGGNVTPAAAQDGGSFSIGPRLTFVRGAEGSAEGTQRFNGGVIRLGGGKTAIELAMDYRSGLTGDLTERVRNFPIQASLLLFPVRTRLAPYLLAGVGWYTQRVTRFSAPTGTTIVEDETTRKMGYHGGFGAELRLHRRFGLYGDYRYTMIRFGGDPDSDELVPSPIPGFIPGSERLRLAHEGSMFTWGATFHF